MDHATGTILQHNIGALCNMNSELCSMRTALYGMGTVLCNMRTALCNMGALCDMGDMDGGLCDMGVCYVTWVPYDNIPI